MTYNERTQDGDGNQYGAKEKLQVGRYGTALDVAKCRRRPSLPKGIKIEPLNNRDLFNQ